MSAVEVVDAYLADLPGTRRLAHAEWGLRVDGLGGAPLDIGVRVADELLRVQTRAAGADAALDPWLLLHWNRQTRLVRFGSTRAGDVWVHGDMAVSGLDARAVDRLLGLVVEGAVRAREYSAAARGASESRHGGERSWLSGVARPPAAG